MLSTTPPGSPPTTPKQSAVAPMLSGTASCVRDVADFGLLRQAPEPVRPEPSRTRSKCAARGAVGCRSLHRYRNARIEEHRRRRCPRAPPPSPQRARRMVCGTGEAERPARRVGERRSERGRVHSSRSMVESPRVTSTAATPYSAAGASQPWRASGTARSCGTQPHLPGPAGPCAPCAPAGPAAPGHLPGLRVPSAPGCSTRSSSRPSSRPRSSDRRTWPDCPSSQAQHTS